MQKKRLIKNFKKIIAFMVILLTVFTVDVLAKTEPTVKRIEGKNRIETSIAISKEAFESKAKTAIIIGYHGEVDALAGTILAEKKKAPILISGKKQLGDNIKNELVRLGTQEVFILGGTGSVNENIEKELRGLNLDVTRLGGNNREDTAISIGKQAIDGEVNEVFLSLGYKNYADALAIVPIAARKNMPLLLTKSKELSNSTLNYIDASNIKTVNIIGGEGAVSKKVENTLKKKGISINRIEGNNREETAISIANTYVKDPKKIFIANGYHYVDAVIGGYLAAKEEAPIILTHGSKLSKSNSEYIKQCGLDIRVLGGKSSIGDNVLKDIKISLGLIKEEPLEDKKHPENYAELKQVIHKGLNSSSTEMDIKYKGDTVFNHLSDEIGAILNEFTSNGSYIAGNINGTSWKVSTSSDSPISNITINIDYLTTREQEAFIDKEISRIIQNIIKPGMSEFDKVKTIHDYIINNTTYSRECKTTPHSAYALLKEGKGVCQAYTLATYKFLDKVGIKNYYVSGWAGNGAHAWNKVKVNGKWYNLDVTWDDPVSTTGEDILRYDYFLISDIKLSKTHTANTNNFPKAIDTKYD